MKLKKAVFLDRDGIINRERGFTFRLEDFEILPDVVPALVELKKRGYLLIIVSNQSGISKGLYTQEDVETLHSCLSLNLKKSGIVLDEIYYCIHHPEQTNCICRKPDSLFIEKSLARFGLDAASCCFIGDKERDTEAAAKAGVRGILVEANTSLLEIIKLID